MSHDNEFCKKQIVERLLGGTITGALESEDDFGDEFFGIRVMKDGKQLAVWVQSDAEGNGPGWIEVEEIDGKRSRPRSS
jgi:hypothetical protein